jgi:23S rRNA pseudouridine1911/1915/1917 synthase
MEIAYVVKKPKDSVKKDICGERIMHPLFLTIESCDEGRQLKQVVFSRLKLGHHLFSRIKFQNGLLVDGVPAHADQRVHAGQIITLILPKDSDSQRIEQAVPLSIAFEDEDLLIIIKPAPLPSQASAHQGTDTLENHVAAHLKSCGPFVYRPVNRLDKGVSGLMVVAKNAYAQQQLQRKLHTMEFIREYLAVVEGVPQQTSGVIDAPIGKIDPKGVKRYITPDGKHSITHYETLQTAGERSLVKLRLETGRTHQIRVHMQHIGCPVVGDFLYGQETAELPGRIALHSHHLECLHPVTMKPLSLTAPLPEELEKLLKETKEHA